MKREYLRFGKSTACLFFLAITILSSGCYVTEFNPDGSGVLTREIVIPPGTEPQKFCPGAGRGYNTRVEGNICKASAQFRNLNELRELIEAVKSPSVRINQLERTADGRLKVDFSVATPEWPAEYVGHAYYWKLKMPGQIISHNAHQANGGELTWQVKSDNGVFRVEAESRVH
jgi:hypothetical protein